MKNILRILIWWMALGFVLGFGAERVAAQGYNQMLPAGTLNPGDQVAVYRGPGVLLTLTPLENLWARAPGFNFDCPETEFLVAMASGSPLCDGIVTADLPVGTSVNDPGTGTLEFALPFAGQVTAASKSFAALDTRKLWWMSNSGASMTATLPAGSGTSGMIAIYNDDVSASIAFTVTGGGFIGISGGTSWALGPGRRATLLPDGSGNWLFWSNDNVVAMLGLNNAFAGNNTHSGAETYTGTVNISTGTLELGGSSEIDSFGRALSSGLGWLYRTAAGVYEDVWGPIDIATYAALSTNTVPWPTVHLQGYGAIADGAGGDLELTGSPTGTITASITGTALTVTAVAGGTSIWVGEKLYFPGISAGTYVTAQVSGTSGGIGVYSVGVSQIASSQTMDLVDDVITYVDAAGHFFARTVQAPVQGRWAGMVFQSGVDDSFAFQKTCNLGRSPIALARGTTDNAGVVCQSVQIIGASDASTVIDMTPGTGATRILTLENYGVSLERVYVEDSGQNSLTAGTINSSGCPLGSTSLTLNTGWTGPARKKGDGLRIVLTAGYSFYTLLTANQSGNVLSLKDGCPAYASAISTVNQGGSGFAVGDVLTSDVGTRFGDGIAGDSGNGVAQRPIKLLVTTAGAITSASVSFLGNGWITTLPTNPVTFHGGSGTGRVTITFTYVAPASGASARVCDGLVSFDQTGRADAKDVSFGVSPCSWAVHSSAGTTNDVTIRDSHLNATTDFGVIEDSGINHVVLDNVQQYGYGMGYVAGFGGVGLYQDANSPPGPNAGNDADISFFENDEVGIIARGTIGNYYNTPVLDGDSQEGYVQIGGGDNKFNGSPWIQCMGPSSPSGVCNQGVGSVISGCAGSECVNFAHLGLGTTAFDIVTDCTACIGIGNAFVMEMTPPVNISGTVAAQYNGAWVSPAGGRVFDFWVELDAAPGTSGTVTEKPLVNNTSMIPAAISMSGTSSFGTGQFPLYDFPVGAGDTEYLLATSTASASANQRGYMRVRY